MNRNSMLAIGGALWAAVAVDTVVHVAIGDWIAPAIAVLVGVGFVAARRVRRRVPTPG
jgi:precorrin isomerase